ncbi:MAG: RnfABCDGE type electron transport complex subunit B [Acidobacteria bacterium]|nr:RnfABCDGE type electron transport complex subunit B [Acidobacteriota bacterium]
MLEAILTLSGLAILASFGLGLAAKFFAVKVDPRVEKIEEILPGANCGGCGAAGCSDFAKGVVEGKYAANACPVGGPSCAAKIAEILGEEVRASEPRVAIVLCAGDEDQCGNRFDYNGIYDCNAADLIQGGFKACTYGCLGLGSCARACPFDAIVITDKRLAVIDRDKCVGCGKCVPVCPRKLITLVPVSRKTHILCSSHDPGAEVRKKCKVGCIACKKCEKTVNGEGISINNFLAVMDYSKDLDGFALETVCPTHTIQRVDQPALQESEKTA